MTQSQNESTTETNSHVTEEPEQQALEAVLSLMKTLAKYNNSNLISKYPHITANLLTYIHQNMNETDLTDVVLQEAFVRALKLSKQPNGEDLERLIHAISTLPPKQRAAVKEGLSKLMRARSDSGSEREYLPLLRLFDDPLLYEPSLDDFFLDDSLLQRDVHTVRIRIDEEPLTVQNLNTAISALTDLLTKCWLIAKGRYADLIEYTQTHNSRFAEEANVVITRVSYNSPFNMDWKVDISATGVADALITTIDGISQRKERLEKAQIENQAKVQQIKEAEQKVEQDKQKAELEREKQQIELEKQRLELLWMQLDMQKKSFEYALELAGKVIDTLQPGLDPATRAMAIQAILPNIIQLDSVKGLSLALPTTPESTK